MKSPAKLILSTLFVLITICACNETKKDANNLKNIHPWCIVAFDSLERSPEERILLLKDLGFDKYAYDWRDHHLDEMAEEIELARANNIKIISVWLWLNAKRDSLGKLSPSNERMFDILKETHLITTIWLSFSNNFFDDLSSKESLERAVDMVRFISEKTDELGCEIALYNHGGWFGNPFNQIEIINELQQDSISIVYNFHHAHESLKEFPQIAKAIQPYLSAVNLNGMRAGGPKILTLGKGDQEQNMVRYLQDAGFDGPWGILGHVENADVEHILRQNITGLRTLNLYAE